MTRVQLMADWLGHALRLLARDDIDVNAAHNKLKHGLAVRSRDDLRVAFIRQAPEDGTVPLSAFTSPDAVDLIDSGSLDYLSRPRARNGRKQGMEVTTLRLSPATLLAETWMMALTYGAMFHVAAARHFGARAEVQFPGYPDVPLGPTPDQLLRDSVIGIRHPVTTPPMGVRPTADQDSLSTRGSCRSTLTCAVPKLAVLALSWHLSTKDMIGLRAAPAAIPDSVHTSHDVDNRAGARSVDTFEPTIPLPGHSHGHTRVAIRADTDAGYVGEWLLHAGRCVLSSTASSTETIRTCPPESDCSSRDSRSTRLRATTTWHAGALSRTCAGIKSR
jgi:hypothetical protein